MEVRYWAAARAAAGVHAERVPAGSLAQVLDAARSGHAATPRFAEVLAVCSVLVDEHPVGGRDHATVDVPAGSIVDLLPPFAGGMAVGAEHPPGETRCRPRETLRATERRPLA